MATKNRSRRTWPPARWYRGVDVPMSVIRRFARQVAERFQPDKIILFGSHAYEPTSWNSCSWRCCLIIHP